MGLNGIRRLILPRLHPIFKKFGRPLIRDKTNRDEWICATDKSIKEIRRLLQENGFLRNPISTLKYTVSDGTRKYEKLSMVHFDADKEWQTHCYVIAGDKINHIYAHYEPSILRPFAHQDWDDAQAGDPKNRVPF